MPHHSTSSDIPNPRPTPLRCLPDKALLAITVIYYLDIEIRITNLTPAASVWGAVWRLMQPAVQAKPSYWSDLRCITVIVTRWQRLQGKDLLPLLPSHCNSIAN